MISEVFFLSLFFDGREAPLFFSSSRTKTHQNKREIQNENIYYSLLHSLSAIKRVVLKRDVFTFFFVFFSRCECLDEDETTTTTTE